MLIKLIWALTKLEENELAKLLSNKMSVFGLLKHDGKIFAKVFKKQLTSVIQGKVLEVTVRNGGYKPYGGLVEGCEHLFFDSI